MMPVRKLFQIGRLRIEVIPKSADWDLGFDVSANPFDSEYRWAFDLGPLAICWMEAA